MSFFKGPNVEEANPDFRPRTSVIKLLEEAMLKNGDATAMIEGQTGKTASFREILQQSRCVSAGLCTVGVAAGDYVVICGNKSILAYSILLGTMFTGATAVLCHITYADKVHKLTKGFQIKAVFCDTSILDAVRESMQHLHPTPLLFGTIDEQDDVVRSLLTHQGVCPVYEAKDIHSHVPLVLFSSGTTGEPKGIMIKDLYVQLRGVFFNSKSKTFFNAAPLTWLSGLTFFISSTLRNYTLILSNSKKPSDNLQLMQKYQVDGCFLSKILLSRYINEPTIQNFDLSSLKNVFTAGDYVFSSLLEDFISKVVRNRDVSLNVIYGTIEAGTLASSELRREDGKFKAGSCGQLSPGTEIKILDEDGNVVPVGCLGAVLAKNIGLTPGYWGRPDLNDQLFNQDGFLITGDAGFFDKDGYLYVRGRMEDLINFRGTKIWPVDVEDILMSHPAVMDVAVVAKPHPVDIHHIAAFVVLNPTTTTSDQELMSFVHGKVGDSMKIRGGVHFLDLLPGVEAGKIQRHKLRELFLDLS